MATKLQPPPNVGQDINSRQWKDWLYSIYASFSSVGGLGTMASQNANNVVITGGTIGGVALSGDSINNTPIGAITPSSGAFSTLKTTSLTGYLYGHDNTGNVTASTTVPYTDVTTIPYGAFHDTTTQTAAANTATAITFNGTDYSNNVAIGSPTSKIIISKAGTYSVSFSIQGDNSGSQVDNITVWFRINGSDIANSAGISAIPAKHGSTHGALVFGWVEYLTFSAGDYLQMYWTTDSGTSSLTTYPVGSSPTHPLSPCVALSLNYIAP